jgi:two-component system sensor histidine kinase ChvG
MSLRGFRSIRTRLLGLTLILLAVPYVGYRYVQEMEGFLRRGQEDALLGGARALAGALHGREALFPQVRSGQPDLYAHVLPTAPQVDGYAKDWGAVASRARLLDWESAQHSVPEPRLALGMHAEHVYLLLDVEDATPSRATAGDPLSGDHVVLRVRAQDGERIHYLIDTGDTGPVQARALIRDNLGQPGTRRELRIHGVQRRADRGYTLELRVPTSLLGTRLALSVTDAASPGGPAHRAGSTRPDGELGALVLPSADIASIVTALGATPGRRIWVVDDQSRVLARGGTLTRATAANDVPAIYHWILRTPAVVRFDDPGPVDKLDNADLSSALTGQTATRWRASDSNDLYVVSAAHPIWSGDRVVGAVLVEESSLPIQTARSQALAELFTTTLVVFALAAVAIGVFASSVSRRLRRLRDDANAAIDEHGRVIGSIGARYGDDEIGELANGMNGLLDRLAQYNRYLERLAGRLAHELRTPLAVIRSSLDNVEPTGPDADFIGRARGGVDRLQSLITRLGEVSRIEEAVRHSEADQVDLKALLSGATEGYRSAWPNQPFTLTLPEQSAEMVGSGDLLAQMLDKLVANAVDFAAESSDVDVLLECTVTDFVVTITNQGAELPEDMSSRLFESMVSVRQGGGNSSEPHLGLGLYIVRLIAESHGGTVRALQYEQPTRVAFEVTLPRVVTR